ncbi:uncharacterized protein [Heterodontus francisci]|uniref:uncharacterized protein n=1 Tax=Heterodontus francisci TaxID=7792 RepID=UPI00355C14EF
MAPCLAAMPGVWIGITDPQYHSLKIHSIHHRRTGSAVCPVTYKQHCNNSPRLPLAGRTRAQLLYCNIKGAEHLLQRSHNCAVNSCKHPEIKIYCVTLPSVFETAFSESIHKPLLVTFSTASEEAQLTLTGLRSIGAHSACTNKLLRASTGRPHPGSGLRMFREDFSLLLIFQVLWIYVAGSGPFLSQSPFTVTAEVGQPVELTCHQPYEVEVVTSYFWYKQLVGEAPRLIDIPPCEATDCKFTSKKGNSKYELILEIRNVQVNDSGSYYCADRDGYAPLQNGPTLLVGDSSTDKTALLVFVPPGELHLRETVPLVCLVSGVSSKQIVIFWNISGQLTEGRSDSGTMQPDGTYSIRSHVMVSGESRRSGGVCTCIAELGSPGKSWTKSVSISKAVSEPCKLTVPAAITGAVILVLFLILISIWIHKRGRSEERVRRGHNENFSLRERTQRGERNQRRSDDIRQTEARRTHQGAKQSQGGPTYASLEFVALEKRSKKKAGRR